MRIDVSDEISLSPFCDTDRAACIDYLNEPEIYRRTLRIPFPYDETHFEQWLSIVGHAREQHGEPTQFAIRDRSQRLIGGMGFDRLIKGHRAEIGYWLGVPYWGRGIMSAVVDKAVAHACDRWELMRIEAYVFSTNSASTKVLEKNRFQLEGVLRRYHLKDGEPIDAKLYAYSR